MTTKPTHCACGVALVQKAGPGRAKRYCDDCGHKRRNARGRLWVREQRATNPAYAEHERMRARKRSARANARKKERRGPLLWFHATV